MMKVASTVFRPFVVSLDIWMLTDCVGQTGWDRGECLPWYVVAEIA
jgi:hypothetical protein